MSGWSVPEQLQGGAEREAVRVTFTLTEQDLRRGVKELPATRRVLIGWVGGFLVLAVVMLLTDGPDASDLWLVPIGILGFMFSYFLRMNVKRQHRSMPEAERTITYEFTPTGFSNESAGASAQLDYSRVHRVVDGKHSLLIFCNPHTAQVVPKRAFSPGDLAIVQRWLHSAVIPRRAKNFAARTLILWVVMIVVFLAIWQFLAPNTP